jgi:glycosyltransferase involved in cell wall biosynthesis
VTSPRLAWVSPLPPTPSGIADYSSELLPEVAQLATVDAVAARPGRFRRTGRPGDMRVLDPAAFERERSYDAIVYHLGNNPHHEFVYRAAVERPGVAVFHDFSLHHLISFLTAERKDFAGYRRLLEDEYGSVGARLFALRVTGVHTDYEKFLFPLNAHVARRARALVVHSDDVRERVEDVAPGIPVAVIPHHAGAPPAEVTGVTREEARRMLGLPPEGEAFLVGHFGFITRPKQPHAVVGGFARVAGRRPDAALIMVGADHTAGGLARLVARHRLEGRVRLRGFVDLVRFYLHLKAVDAVVNLRYPSAGESSGTVARSLAEGRATIVNNLGSFAQIPRDAVLKVEIDGDQAEQVGHHLLRLAEDPALRAPLEERARAYADSVLDPRRCAGLYVQIAQTAAA